MLANIGDLPWVVAIALIVLVAGSQLPKIARNVGLAGKEFRRATDEGAQEQAARPAPAADLALSATAARPAAPAEPVVTLTASQFEALLGNRSTPAVPADER